MPGCATWFKSLTASDQRRIDEPIKALEQYGPALSGGLAKRVKTSRHHNMKELRSVGGNIRILFAFDPRRKGILLVGGDKTNNWDGWYLANVPIADRRFEDHLRQIGKDGTCQRQRAGARSAGRSR